MTRCKFRCDSVTKTRDGFSAAFSPVMSGSKENEIFFKYTPWGKFEIGTTKEQIFEPGKEYYLDITEDSKNE